MFAVKARSLFLSSLFRVARPLAIVMALALLLVNQADGAAPGVAPHAAQFEADVALAWFDLAYSLARDEVLAPPIAARAFGYLGVALYESVAPGIPGYQSLAGQLNGLPPLPTAAAAYHWPTVANSALSATLQALLPATRDTVKVQEAALATQLRRDAPAELLKQSVARGRLVGRAIARWAAQDGFHELTNCAYAPPVGAGLWTPTPPAFKPALQPCWGQMRPFVLPAGSACSPAAPPPYSTEPGSPFHREAREVYEVSSHLTPQQRTIALYWADDPGVTGTPPGHSISILSQVLRQEEASLALAAEAYARTGIAVSDAFIACWWTKFEFNLLRPVTYIHEVLGDEQWTPLVNTPPFPEYTSGHSVQSAAAAQVLADMFGQIPFTDHTHDARGFAPRTFDSFFAFAEEAAISRLYGGIHFRAAIEAGLEQGLCIGRRVSALQFRS